MSLFLRGSLLVSKETMMIKFFIIIGLAAIVGVFTVLMLRSED